MWKVDSTGTFEFSDNTDPYQPLLFSQPDYSLLQRMLSTHFRGQTVSVEDVEEYVIAGTAFYKFMNEALKQMEANGQKTVISSDFRRREGTFAEGKTWIKIL